MNALNSAFGLSKQAVKGTKMTTGFTWFLASENAGGPQPRIRQLPMEMGAGLLSRGMIKTGVSGAASLKAIPRPNSMGLPLLGLAGSVTTVHNNLVQAANSHTALTVGAQTGVDISGSDPAAPRAIVITGLPAAGNIVGNVVVYGTDVNDASIQETFALTASTQVVQGTLEFKTLATADFPAWTTTGDFVDIGFGDGTYTHTFVIGTDAAFTDYFTIRRAVSTSFGEEITDGRVSAMSLAMQALNYVDGGFAIDGITPNIVADVSGWNATPDSTPPFISGQGVVKINTADTLTTFPVSSATLNVQNAHEIEGEFIIGQLVPRDIDVIGRAINIVAVAQVVDKTLYQKLMYDPLGVSTSWLASMFNSAELDLQFITAEDIPAKSGTKYNLSVSAANTQWVAEPIGLRGTDIVLVRLNGIVTEPASGVPITFALTNDEPAY